MLRLMRVALYAMMVMSVISTQDGSAGFTADINMNSLDELDSWCLVWARIFALVHRLSPSAASEEQVGALLRPPWKGL